MVPVTTPNRFKIPGTISLAQARADIYGLDRDTLNTLRGDRRSSDTPIARNYNSSSKPVTSAVATPTTASDRRSRESSYPTSPGYTTRDSYEIPGQLRSAYQGSERGRIW